MPRQRRRHHSKSRSRSRSHSHDKDREAKRRKVELCESPNIKRSVSPQDVPSSDEKAPKIIKEKKGTISVGEKLQLPKSKSTEDTLCVKNSEVAEADDDVISIDSDSEEINVSSRTSLKTSNEEQKSAKSEKKNTKSKKLSTSTINTQKNGNTEKTKAEDSDDVVIVEPLEPRRNTAKTSVDKKPTRRIKPILLHPPEGGTPKKLVQRSIAFYKTPPQKCDKAPVSAESSEQKTTKKTQGIIASEKTSLEEHDNKSVGNKSSESTETVDDDVVLVDPDVESTTPVSRTKSKRIAEHKPDQAKQEEQTTPKSKIRKSTIASKNEKKLPDEPSTTPKPEASIERDPDDVVMAEPTTPSMKALADQTTPSRRLTPKQMQRQLESEKKKQQKEKEREEREKQKQDEKDKKEAERLKKKEEKQKEIEQKQKEKDEKEEQRKREKEQKRIEKEKKEEEKRLEKEKKEEQKRKEKEEEKIRKQQEIDEKNKEKLKEEEKKQKAAAAFVSFFVSKNKSIGEEKKAEEKISTFMPFEVKSDMKLPPPRRKPMTEEEKNNLIKLLENNRSGKSYLIDLKSVKPRTCPKTWPYLESEEEVVVIDDEEVLGETICEEKPKSEVMRAKYLKFHENQRPAYHGTWRKKSKTITGRRPFGKETVFDYEVDSDDDWEEEEQGENLEVMSDDDKENEPENEDYEVDNEFFVPHGHLSDDEVDDEENAKLSPESQKQKLKLLKDAFDEDIKSKTHKIKPRSIGCIWYNKDGQNVDAAIDRYLHPLTIITNGPIEIKKRNTNETSTRRLKMPTQDIPENIMPVLLRLVHGNTIKRKLLVQQFLNYIETNNVGLELSRINISRHILNVAQWTKNSELKNKFCWMVNKGVAEKYSVDLVLPNTWQAIKDGEKV